MPERAAIYAWFRGEQHPDPADDLDAQEERCRSYAAAQGYQVVDVFRETASEVGEDRPELKRLRTLVWQRGVDVILATRPDRVYVDLNRLTRLVNEVRLMGARLEFLEQPFIIQEE
ncbi:MAG: recombinase family protein [Sphaerobacter sp.]|nr:recombinase family protein [Sphaerobacter sp.]